MPSERQKDQPITPYQQTQILMQQFGSIAKIPDEELFNIGFRKANPEIDGYSGLVRITPANKEKSQTTEKIKNAPFEKIEIDINTTPEGFRRIKKDIPLIRRRLQAVSDLTDFQYDDELNLVMGRKFEMLASKYSRIPDIEWQTGDKADYSPRYQVHLIVFGFIPSDVFGVGSAPIERNLNLENYLTARGEMSSIDTRQFHTELERCRAKLGDPERFRRRFDSLLDNNFVDSDDLASPNLKDRLFPEFLVSKGLSSGLDLTKFAFYEVLTQEGFGHLGKTLLHLKTTKEVIEAITSFKIPMTTALAATEKELRAKLRVTDKQDRPLMTKLNDELRITQGIRRERLMLLEGMVEYYNIPNFVADTYRGKIRAVQDILISKSDSEDAKKVLITLDGRPDVEKDCDPGVLSGDCTEGNPLPFDDPNIPLYNVKVLQNDEHIGNIYLLYTQTSNKKLVWHLEAIQIPKSALDWHSAIPAFIDRLLVEASKRGVDAVTINREDTHISNYDYIANAALAYAGKVARSEYIDVPIVTKEGRSGFQSTGEVYAFSVSTPLS